MSLFHLRTKHNNTQAPSTCIQIFLNPPLFLSSYGFHPHTSGKFDSKSRYFWICPPEWKNLIRNVSDSMWIANPDIFESDDVVKSCPVSYRTINQYGGTTSRLSSSDVCGQANSIWIRYVWMEKCLNPERKSCGFKNILNDTWLVSFLWFITYVPPFPLVSLPIHYFLFYILCEKSHTYIREEHVPLRLAKGSLQKFKSCKELVTQCQITSQWMARKNKE